MKDFFIKKYSKIKNNSPTLSKLQYYAAQRFWIRLFSNVLVPIYFKCTNIFQKKYITKNTTRETQIIVSLTTFPARINRIWIVLECMIRQKMPPDKIILWLSKEQFSSLEVLPKSLKALQKRGVEIVLCEEDIRSHKKYFYSLKKFTNDILITIDDDFIYPSTLILELIESFRSNPTAISCFRAVQIQKSNNVILPYIQWKYIYGGSGPSYNLFFTSGGGTLFPPNSLNLEVLNSTVFLEICPLADDIWLNIMAQINETKTLKIKSTFEIPIPLIYRQNIKLASINVNESQNDKQLDAVRSFYKNKLKLDPFSKVFK